MPGCPSESHGLSQCTRQGCTSQPTSMDLELVLCSPQFAELSANAEYALGTAHCLMSAKQGFGKTMAADDLGFT